MAEIIFQRENEEMKRQLVVGNSNEKQPSETEGTQQKEKPEEPSTTTRLTRNKSQNSESQLNQSIHMSEIMD